MLDPANVTGDPYFCLTPEELFESRTLVERSQRLSLLEKLRAIEIAWKPTGFTCVAGRSNSYCKCDPRISAAVLSADPLRNGKR